MQVIMMVNYNEKEKSILFKRCGETERVHRIKKQSTKNGLRFARSVILLALKCIQIKMKTKNRMDGGLKNFKFLWKVYHTVLLLDPKFLKNKSAIRLDLRKFVEKTEQKSRVNLTKLSRLTILRP
jgi:hypothetical protein